MDASLSSSYKQRKTLLCHTSLPTHFVQHFYAIGWSRQQVTIATETLRHLHSASYNAGTENVHD